MVLLSPFLWLCLGAVSAMPTLPSPLVKRAGGGSCTSPEFVAPVVVGGTAGTPFCESDWGQGYLPITGLTVWSNADDVTGIQATYSDGSQGPVLGRTATVKQTKISVDYGLGDSFTRVSLYGVKAANSFLHHLLLETKAGAELNAGSVVSSDPKATRYDQSPGTGILFGLAGTTNGAGSLSSLSFLFLGTPIAALAITDLQFPNGPVGTTQGITPTTIGTAHFYNNGAEAQQYQFNNQLAEMQQWAFAQAYTNTFTVMEGIAIQLMFSFLGIGGSATSTTTFVWTTTEMSTTTTTVTQSEQVQYNTQVTLQPGQGVDCVAIAGQGSGTFMYSSQVTLTLSNGNKYTFPENGYLTVSALSQGQATCTEADHP